MHKTTAWLFVAVLLAAGSAAAQSNCSDGTIHDDNSFEAGYGFPTDQPRGTYVMRIDPPATPSQLDSVCLCFLRDSTDNEIQFDLNVWASNGPGGGPGTLLGRLSSRVAAGIPENTPTFYRYNLSALGIVVDGPVFIGPSWQPSVDQNIYLCADNNGPTSKPGYFSLSSNENTPPASPINFPNYRTLGVRAKLTPVTTGSCVPNDTTMCLNNGRFQVRATFQTPTGQPENARVEKLTGDTGFLWFFSASNVEAVIKVLNGCGLNNHYWVLGAATTDVGYELEVFDPISGLTRTYDNIAGRASPAIIDLEAFPCN
jgi:hypothetical protein